jgi:hypothetical protein
MTTKYHGHSYRAQSGQWSWKITRDGEDYCAGAGYPDETDAEEALSDQLAHLQPYEPEALPPDTQESNMCATLKNRHA